MTINRPLRPSAAAHRPAHTLLTALAPATWGTTYLVTTELLPPGHPLFAALLRALPAGLVALLIARTLPRGGWWWKAAVLGILNIGLFFPLLFVTAQRLPGGVAATLGAVQPIVVALLAVALLAERPSHWRLAWGLVGVVGVGLVTLGPGAGFDAVGLATGVLGTSVVGLGIVLTKRWGRPAEVGPVGFAGWQLTAGGLFLLPLALLFEGAPGRVDTAALAGYTWLGLAGGLVAYTLWFDGLRRLPVTATALLVLLSPLVAAILGVAFAGERLDALQVTGFALALTALAAGQLTPGLIAPGRYRRARPSAQP
ncbi:EamA family transporter [Nocardioides daejeonensis]|uniref:EamA family transporter n=1 Tax=Nocardioides daejeonensis TaxID=1046556 RepID=UPI000D748DCD|nr:EamA family transporter [Nocardioides daejeonensis]